jgi:BirA family biotin operon repressor/biotin-[acetyl-CoA-carboxylase] ligase
VPFVRRLIVLETTGSTNDDVRRLAAEGAPEGTVVLAESQSAGRGRLGRSWDSPERMGLYLSVLLRPTEPLENLGRYPIATAVAVCAACRVFAGESAVLKWPNDVVAPDGKLAGILSELRHGASGAELVVGIGVNVNQTASDFDSTLRDRATSLRMLGRGVGLDREEVATSVFDSLGETMGLLRDSAWPEVRVRFLSYAPDAIGRRVRLADGGGGLTDGLDAS